MRPDTRSPVCAHRASPPPCRRFGTVLLATKRHPASAASAFTRVRPDTRSPVRAHRASPPPCRRFGTVLLATKRHPASAASAFTRVRPDTRSPVRAHRASPPPCRRFGTVLLATDCLPRKAPGPSCRRRRTADVAKHPFALRRPPADLGPSGALHARPGGNGLRFPDVVPTRPTSKYAPYYTRLVGNVPAPTSPAPLRANPDRTRAVAGIHPRTSAVPDVSAAVGPSFAAGSAPTFGATGGSVSSMRNSPSRSFCQSRIYP